MSWLFRAYQFARYLLRGKTRYYIHSPFVYSFINEVMRDKRGFYCYDEVEALRERLSHSKETIEVQDYGAGSTVMKSRERKVTDILSLSVKSPKYARLLFRMVSYYGCLEVVELGTSLGITTLYLSSANDKCRVTTLEGSPAIAQLAQKNFDALGRKNIELKQGTFEDKLAKVLKELARVDLVYFDGNHRFQPTMDYFNQCLAKAHNDSIFVFDDIYWSPEMTQAWEAIKAHEQVTLTIDLFQLGIVFFRKEKKKEHFTLYF